MASFKNMKPNAVTLMLRTGVALLALATGACDMMKPQPQGPRTFIVFFPAASADLPAEAQSIIDEAAVAVKNTRPSTVALAGYVYNSGNQADNRRMAERRVEAVAQALAAEGVDPKLFLRLPLGGADDSAGQTGDRRLEVRLQYGG